MSETSTETTETAPAVSYEKGTWQAALQRSAALFDKSGNDRKRAGVLLWQGGQSAIGEWADSKSDTDVHAEVLYADLLDVMGTSRKGDVSKIKTVALAVKNYGLVTSAFNSLSKAYAEARRLTQTQVQDAADDDAADKAVEALAASVPNSTTTVEGAALILLSKGIDGAVVAILDALGANNEAAHRSFMRAVATEINARIQAAKPKPTPKAPATPKTGATKATPAKDGASKAKATPATKAKPAAKGKATPAAKATPVSASKGDPNKKALPPKAQSTPVEPAPVEDPAEDPAEQPAGDMFEEFSDEEVEAQTPRVTTPPVPVKRS